MGLSMRKSAFGVILGLMGVTACEGWRVAEARPGARITINGHVTSGRQPAAGAVLTFNPTNKNSVPAIKAPIRPDGTYSVSLPEQGGYRVGFRPTDLLSVGSVTLEVKSSEVIDFEIPATAVTFRASGQRVEAPIQLYLFDGSHRLAHATFTGILRAKDLGVTLYGIPVGRYFVSADSMPAVVAQPVNIQIETGRPVDVNLSLSTGRGSLRLRSASGAELTGVEASVDARNAAVGVGAVVDLSRVSPGMPMLFKATGHLPKCALAPAERTAEAVIDLQPEGTSSSELRISVGTQWPAG